MMELVQCSLPATVRTIAARVDAFLYCRLARTATAAHAATRRALSPGTSLSRRTSRPLFVKANRLSAPDEFAATLALAQ